MVPYEIEQFITVPVANTIVPLPFPGRCTIDRIAVVRLDSTAITVSIYNRAFTGPLTPNKTIENDGHGKTLLRLGARMAIKAGDVLSEQEMRSLIDQLFATKMPYVCPHGRPIVLRISLEELDRRFGRTS